MGTGSGVGDCHDARLAAADGRPGGAPGAGLLQRGAGLAEQPPDGAGGDARQAVGRGAAGAPQGRERPGRRASGVGGRGAGRLAQAALPRSGVVGRRATPGTAGVAGGQPLAVEPGDPVGDGSAALAACGPGGLLVVRPVGDGEDHDGASDVGGGCGGGPAEAAEVSPFVRGEFAERVLAAA